MNTTSRGNPNDKAAELFGAAAEREAFERGAQDRAGEPQTARWFVTWVTVPIITVCAAC